MRCVECQELLFAYVEGLVDDEQKDMIEKHVADCDVCQQEEQTIRTLQDRLSDQGQLFNQSTLETEVMSAIVREQKVQYQSTQQASLALKLRRQIMNRPLSKIVVAAMVVIAFAICMSLWTSSSSVALADVLTKIETVAVYMFQTTSTMIGEPIESNPFESDEPATIYVSKDLGYAEKVQQNTMEMYMLPNQQKAFMINHKEKQYFEMEFNEDLIKRQQGHRDARAVVRNILHCEYESLGQDTIDGILCEGFRTTDPAYDGGLFGEVKIELWVDLETYLPVRLETEMQVSEDRRIHTISDAFQWDVVVDARAFEPVIPDGYSSPLNEVVQVPAMDEASLVKGLQFLKDIGCTTYPETLSMMDMANQMKMLQTKMMEMMKSGDKEGVKAFMRKHYDIDLDQGKPDQEKMMKATMRITMASQGTSMAYSTLVRDQKDPAYHGKVVTPNDADLPLVRWKVSDNEYRVIFGDLHAETVSVETLHELEASLPTQ